MTTAELTLYRCYWPPAHAYLKAQGTSFSSQAFDLLMTLEVGIEHVSKLLECLPAGVVLGTEMLSPFGLRAESNDEPHFMESSSAPTKLGNN